MLGYLEKSKGSSLHLFLLFNYPSILLRSLCYRDVSLLRRKYLLSPHNLPLHEVYYYNNVVELRQRVDGCPRAAIHHGLSNPYHYLQVWPRTRS